MKDIAILLLKRCAHAISFTLSSVMLAQNSGRSLRVLSCLVVFAAILFQSPSEAEAQQDKRSSRQIYRESRAPATLGGVGGGQGGGVDEYADTFDSIVTNGFIVIWFEPLYIPDTLNLYYPPRKNGGKSIYDTGGPVDDRTVDWPIVVPFTGKGSLFEIVINEGSKADPGTYWFYSITVYDSDKKEVKTYTMSAATSSGSGQAKSAGIYRVNLRVPSARTLVSATPTASVRPIGTPTFTNAPTQNDGRK